MLRLISVFVLVSFLRPVCAQDTLSRDSLLQVIEALRRSDESKEPAQVPIYSDNERLRDSIRLSLTTPSTDYEREKAKAERMWPWAMRFILLGAGVFILWAFLYRKRYRELHTRDGVYYGIGSKYYHDHYEQNHYDGSRYGASAGEDPWCYYDRYAPRGRSLQQPGVNARDEMKNKTGDGASGNW